MAGLKELLINTGAEIEENVPMGKYTSFRAGGRAAVVVCAGSEQQLLSVLSAVSNAGVPHTILGNGTNTLFRDSGYQGVVIRLGSGFSYIEEVSGGDRGKDGEKVYLRCGASVLLSSLARNILDRSLTGFEFASGIPGSLGGALFMNAGADGGEMKDIVTEVRAVSPDGSEIKTFTAEEMEFGYRHSILQENGYIASGAVITLAGGDRSRIAAVMKELNEKRNSKQPVSYPSAGSTFKRPEGHFAGRLIEEAGLKGVAIGGAQVSTLHSGFIINKGGATATDIIDLITLVQNTVYDKKGVMLQPEVRIIG